MWTQVRKAHQAIGPAVAESREGHDAFLMLKQRVMEHVWRMFRNKLLVIEEEVRVARAGSGAAGPRIGRRRQLDPCRGVCAHRATLPTSQIVNEREAKGLSEYTTIHAAKYKDVLDKYTKGPQAAAEQVRLIEELLKQHRGTLAKIFQYYW